MSDRVKKVRYNGSVAMVYQVVNIIYGLVVPRIIILYFGSDMNGMLNSISRFLAFITLAELGVGAVVQSALYRPLAGRDNKSRDEIIIAANSFFRKIGFFLIVYTLALGIVYPYIVNGTEYSFEIFLLVIISAASLGMQYFFSMSRRLLLAADQRSYLINILQVFTLIVNMFLHIYLARKNVSIITLKFLCSISYVIQPIFLKIYTDRRYKLDLTRKVNSDPIEQKWDGLAQHIAAVVLENVDALVLTIFSTLKAVSIYSIYSMVAKGLRMVISSSTSGFQAMFGNMIALDERKELYNAFTKFELGMHIAVTILYSAAMVMMIPFITLYTRSFNDPEYLQPILSITILAAYAVYCLRLAYNTLILAAGHYKETKFSAIMEATINVVLSIVLVKPFGLVGIALSTLVAMLYRTIYFVYYVRDNILYRSQKEFFKNLGLDIVSIILVFIIGNLFNLHCDSYVEFLFKGILILLLAIVVTGVMYWLFRRENLKGLLKTLKLR